ncbi:LLM class flavin-dependent oxidoreductase [Streptomyces apocyni]|uniref:LLM class flavin-dependent oxidoreductase n=1 Tax=Streptomyces apocyni TaxID=2654677 RepID=UPI0012EA7D7D|nr:LLM class flavin-dependent oxidoreductase [Streptomyces apocyni]
MTLAKELISLYDIPGGRITLGIGADGNGFDATELGQEVRTPNERADRFAEFVPLLDRLLTEGAVTERGNLLLGRGVPEPPGLLVAAPATVRGGGDRAARAEAGRQVRAGIGDDERPELYEAGTLEQSVEALRGQIEKLGKACAETGRDATELAKTC